MSLLYKECARIVGLSVAGRGSVKSLCYATKNPAKTKVYAIVFNVLQNYTVLVKIAKDADLECTPFVLVHLYELLYRGGLKTGGSLKTKLTKILPQLKKLKEKHDVKTASYKRLPLYVRINTLKVTDSVSVISQLKKNFPDFSGDPDVNFLLKFPPTTNFSEFNLYKTGHLMIQDKASCLPAVALSPPRGAVVLDACSAPGNKTLHLAAVMENTGTVYAVERDRKRFNRLSENIKRLGGNKTIRPICADFLEISPEVEPYRSVSHILLDPSCSGSGMVTQKMLQKGANAARLSALAQLQRSLLQHAMKFPSATRIVYSTCSIYKEENECVVRDVLEGQSEWKIETALPGWKHRGDPSVFPAAEKCVRCSEEDDTNGFFLASFVRQVPAAERDADRDFLGGMKIQCVYPVKHLDMRYKFKYHYKYPYKFIKL